MNIFSFFKNRKKKTKVSYNNEEITNYNYTQSDLIVDKMKANETVPLREVNVVLSDYFDIKAIEGTLHRLSPILLKESVFVIEHVNLIVDSDESPKTIRLELKEHVFNLDLTLTVDVKDFHEIFQPVKLTQLS